MRTIAFLLLSISIILLSGCKNNGMTWDISPVVVSVSVVDAQGNDLLDPQTPGALDLTKIKAVYKDQEYECDKDAYFAESRAYKPHFYGLRSSKNNYYGIYLLNFGEFNGAQSYENEFVTIIWPDGSSDKISFNRSFKWKWNGDPSAKEEWFLNNSKISRGLIKIVK